MLPPIIQYVIARQGWRGCLLVLAGITLNCAIFGSFFKPIQLESDEEEIVETEQPPAKPLLIRIKEARAAQWTQSIETLNEESPGGSQNSAPPPYSEVLNIIELSNNNECNRLSTSKPNISKRPVSASFRQRTKSALERKNVNAVTPRDEMMYSNLSLVVLPRTRSVTSINQFGASRIGSKRLDSMLSINQEQTSTWKAIGNGLVVGFDLSLLKRPSFILLSTSGFLCLVGFFIPFIYIGDRAKLLGKY